MNAFGWKPLRGTHSPEVEEPSPARSERESLLGLLVYRARFLTVIEEQLTGFPPEIREAATKRAAEWGAERFLQALSGLQEILIMDGKPKGREEAFRRNHAVGVLLDMDPKDPNMRLWAGESAAAIFGL